MAKPAISTIADAVTAELGWGVWSAEFTPVRRTRPRWTLAELASLRVTVVPGSWESDLEDRDATLDTYAVDVAIQKKLADINDPDQVDPLLALAEEIHDRFRGQDELTDCPGVVWTKTDTSGPMIYPPHAEEANLFTCVLTLFFAMGR